MKKIFLLLFICLLYQSSYSQWFPQTSGTTNRLNGVSFTDANTGTVVGSTGTILRTTNGGTNWISQTSGTTQHLNDVIFIDANTGTAVGWPGIILRTTNGGVFVNQIGNEIPDGFSLYQNYPNPFNPKTKIKFQLSKLSDANLIVYDILGREVATLVNKKLKAGTYEVEFEGTTQPSGVYFYTLISVSFKETKKMLMIK
jgi:hypothetical protein